MVNGYEINATKQLTWGSVTLTESIEDVFANKSSGVEVHKFPLESV